MRNDRVARYNSAFIFFYWCVFFVSPCNIIVNVNNVNAQYFIGTFNANEFPLSIDTCNLLDILGQNGFQKAECVDESTIMWYYYSDAACSAFIASIEYNSTYQTAEGTLYDFNCDNSATQSYLEIEFEAFGCGAAVEVTMNPAIGVCAFLSDDEVSIQIYCEPDWAELYYFDSQGKLQADCDPQDLYNVANATGSECDFMLKTSGIKVYGQVCVVECICLTL